MLIDSYYSFYHVLNFIVRALDGFTGCLRVNIWTLEMTQTHCRNVVEYHLTKPNASVFRPRSSRCSTESRKMSLKHQHSIDFSNDLPSENLLGKRSDSLQSLNSVDNQKSNSKERKTNFKPIKIAWASRAPSEEKNFKTAFENWKTDDTCEHTEPFMDCKNRLEESKKKSIDIFLSRNFIEPTDILPSPNRPKLSLLKSFGTSFTKHEPEKCPDLPIIEDDKKEEIEPDNKSEKKVTFAADLNKKTNAETRRMNFRNSYSKRYTTNFSFSSPRLETQTSIGKCPTPKVEPTNAIKRGNSLTLAENTEELRNLACTSPCFKQPIQTDKMKQFAVKRKLKSCRSRSFHKSLDSSSVIENFDTFSFRKPLKSQNAEVVTMVSLIVSNEDHDSDETTKARNETPRNTKETFKENDPEKQTKTGILKSRWQENIKRPAQPIHRKRIINVPVQKSSSPKSTRTVLATVNNSSMESDQSEIANFHTNDFKECDEEKRDKNEKPFQSAKEQECWSSFRKMTNKGFSVSFDTILRGLLTPTEYRLRKNELLTQET